MVVVKMTNWPVDEVGREIFDFLSSWSTCGLVKNFRERFESANVHATPAEMRAGGSYSLFSNIFTKLLTSINVNRKFKIAVIATNKPVDDVCTEHFCLSIC